MLRSFTRSRSYVSLLFFSLLYSPETPAQDTLTYRIKPITVTATRQPEAVLEVPMAVSMVSPEQFEYGRLIGLDEALVSVPGLFAQSRAGGQDVRITIRGFGARGNGDRSNAGNMRGIRILLDGIPLTEPDGRTSLDLIDLTTTGNIEVVRSNASSLYGGASGGLIHLSTTEFSNPFLRVGSLVGSNGMRSERVQSGFLLGNAKVAMQFSNMVYGGWREHSGSARTLINGSVAAPISEEGKVTIQVIAASNLFRFPGALTAEELARDPRQADSAYVARDERRFNRVGRLGVMLDHAFDEENGFSLTGFLEPKVLQRSERGSYRDFNRYHFGGSGLYRWNHPIGQEARLVFLGGFDEAYQDGTILFYSLDGGNRGTTLKQNKREGANTFGVYLQGELMLASRWSLIAGGRYDILTYRAEDFMQPRLSATKSFSSMTPKVALSYRWRDTHTLYAALGGGVEIPAFNEIDPPAELDTVTALNPFLDPMTSRTYEIGFKGILQIAASRFWIVHYDIALYHLLVRNDIIPYNGGAYFFTAGESRRMGLEAHGTLETRLGLTCTATLTLTDNEYLEYTNDLGNYAGKKVAGLPGLVANASIRYRTPWDFYLEARMQNVGSYYADDANSIDGETDAYTIFHLAAGGTIPLGFAEMELYGGVNNLTDESYVASVFINGLRGRYFEPGLPRNGYAGLKLKIDV